MSTWDSYSNELRESKFSDYRRDYLHEELCISDNNFDNKLLSTHSDNIRDEYRNKVLNRFSTMGRLKRYSTYKFINDGEKLTVQKFKHNMYKKSFRQIISSVKAQPDKHVELGLPLPITKDCHLIGVVDSKARRSYSQSRTYEKDLLVDYFNWKVDTDYVEDEFNNIQTFNGDWRHNSQNLIDMATPKKKTYRRTEIMNGYLSRVNIDFKLPYIHDYDPRLILGLDVKPKAFPGYATSQLIAKHRKESSEYTKAYSLKYAQRIMNNPRQILDTSLITIGGREKRAKYNVEDKGKPVKTRVTCMGEDVPTLISQSVVNPITNCIPEIEDHFNQLAKVYGQGNMLRYKDVMQPDIWQELVCDLDYSGHDNNTNENQIVVAFALLRLCFKPCPKIDRLFYYCMSSMIYKRVIIPESNLVYKLCKGVSTGHGFTSLITTLCAYGTLATSLNRITDKYSTDDKENYLKTTRIGNAGDDCNLKINVNLIEDLYYDVINESGHKIDDIRDNGYIDSNNPRSRVTFLKKQFHDFSWNSRELFTNLVHPTVAEKNFGHRADNLKVLIYQSPMNNNLNNKLICLILCYILSGKGYGHNSMIAAKLNGGILSVYELIERCIDINFDNPDFIDELLKLDYGRFEVTHTYIGNKKIFGYPTIFKGNYISVDAFIKDVLYDFKKQIPKKINWFQRRVNYKMHRSKNTLTVYDYMKVFTKPKSNNISYDRMRIFYDKMSVILSI
jgi:hypothetical protein